jgi:hypothetical protein
MTTIILAIVIGLAFGVALNRIGATNPQNIINMLRLTDLRLFKSIAFGIGLSSVLLFGGMALGIIDPAHLSVKSAYIGVIVGGVIFGAGFAIGGYCPGTSLGAAAAGRKDALFFIGGGLLGAFAYMLSYGWIKTTFLLDTIAGGKVTLAVTENDKYDALFTSLSGTTLALILGVGFMVFAWLIPSEIGEKAKQTKSSSKTAVNEA